MNIYDKIPGAENFTYYEMIRSDTARRLGIENIPNSYQWDCLQSLAINILQPIRNQFGAIKVLSGFRNVTLNTMIGGSSSSNHCKGEAADIEPYNSHIKLIDIGKWIIENLEFRELIFEYMPSGWIHIAYRENDNIKNIKLKDPDHYYTSVTLNDIMQLYT